MVTANTLREAKRNQQAAKVIKANVPVCATTQYSREETVVACHFSSGSHDPRAIKHKSRELAFGPLAPNDTRDSERQTDTQSGKRKVLSVDDNRLPTFTALVWTGCPLRTTYTLDLDVHQAINKNSGLTTG
jgi:hypothetical protein